MGGFVGVIQRGPEEWRHTSRYLFCFINNLVRPKTLLDVAREEPISMKNILKGDTKLSTNKTFLIWVVNIAQLVFALPKTRKNTLRKFY